MWRQSSSITVMRNKHVVGQNCKSYNDKHPENPIDMRPIYNARRRAPVEWSKAENRFVVPLKIWRALKRLVNLARPAIGKRIFQVIGSV